MLGGLVIVLGISLGHRMRPPREKLLSPSKDAEDMRERAT
jgi:hypothetical protein